MNIRTRTARTFRTMRIEDLEGRMMFAGYSFDVFVDPQTENTQYRLFFDDPQAGVDHFQFGVVEETPAGTIHTRGHPDLSEPNGWGAGWIANVFIAGEGSGPVNGHVDSVVSGTGGIDVVASGSVVSTDGSAGTWTWSSTISCDPATQSVDLDGLTQVTLTGPLAGDMNVGKLHGNFQYHVPLNTGGVGNTGDTREIRFTYGPDSPVRELAFVPTPADPANYPTDCSSDVTVTLVGAINLSDPNHTTIRKPTVHHSAISTDPTTKLVAGAQWDSSANNYWSDNLGASQIVTPANTASTTFEFTVRSFWTVPAGRAGSRFPATGTVTASIRLDSTTRAQVSSIFGTRTPPALLIWRSATVPAGRAGSRFPATGTMTASIRLDSTTRAQVSSTSGIPTTPESPTRPLATAPAGRAGSRSPVTGTATASIPRACTPLSKASSTSGIPTTPTRDGRA